VAIDYSLLDIFGGFMLSYKILRWKFLAKIWTSCGQYG